MHLRFSLYAAQDEGETGHPQHVMRALGITYQHATPQSLTDNWWFWNCKNVPSSLPGYLRELTLDPMDCVGRGLDQGTAEAIRAQQP